MRDEQYIIDLCDQILGFTALRQHKFDFLRGDENKRKQRRRLPIDAYYPTLRLAIEYRELQHSEPVAIMDRRMTVSGCPRSIQRRIYDERRRTVLPKHHIRLIELDYRQFAHDRKKKLRRDAVADAQTIRSALARFIQ